MKHLVNHRVCTGITFYKKATGEVVKDAFMIKFMIDSMGKVQEVYQDGWESSIDPRPDLLWQVMVEETKNTERKI